MKIRNIVALLIALYGPIWVFAQNQVKEIPEVMIEDSNASVSNLTVAKFQIYDIKTRGIIIRLKTNTDRIAAFRKEGYTKIADKLEQTSILNNLRLQYAFVTKWSYCPVYFMESQHSRSLLLHDSLVVKTSDLLRDTVLYVNKDSFYMLDYGMLMSNQTLPSGKFRSEQSGSPISDDCLIIKDHNMNQLQPPVPYFTKVIGGDMDIDNYGTPSSLDLSTGRINRFDIYEIGNLSSLPDRSKMQKDTLNLYLDETYAYIESYRSKDKFQKSVSRLNKRLIEYYCKRLAKDKNIICNDDPIYWWHRNPNIRYLPAILKMERELKSLGPKSPKFISSH